MIGLLFFPGRTRIAADLHPRRPVKLPGCGERVVGGRSAGAREVPGQQYVSDIAVPAINGDAILLPLSYGKNDPALKIIPGIIIGLEKDRIADGLSSIGGEQGIEIAAEGIDGKPACKNRRPAKPDRRASCIVSVELLTELPARSAIIARPVA